MFSDCNGQDVVQVDSSLQVLLDSKDCDDQKLHEGSIISVMLSFCIAACVKQTLFQAFNPKTHVKTNRLWDNVLSRCPKCCLAKQSLRKQSGPDHMPRVLDGSL